MGRQENIIALILDLDKTLTCHFTPKYLIEHYRHDEEQFWTESREEHSRLEEAINSEASFPESLRAPEGQKNAGACYEITYPDMILEHIKKGCPRDGTKWEGLNRQLLRKLGSKIEFFSGLPEAFREEKDFVRSMDEWRNHNINLEFHIISLGLADMIKGSSISKYTDGIYAYEFAPAKGEHPTRGTIDKIVNPMTYSGKTQYIYQLNKGHLVNVNEKMAQELRRIPGENMLYLGDGHSLTSDVPAFAVIKRMGGKSIAVYSPYETRCYVGAAKLYSENRVAAIAPADYTQGSKLRGMIREWVTHVAERIVTEEKNSKKFFT